MKDRDQLSALYDQEEQGQAQDEDQPTLATYAALSHGARRIVDDWPVEALVERLRRRRQSQRRRHLLPLVAAGLALALVAAGLAGVQQVMSTIVAAHDHHLHTDLAMLYFHTGDTERALAENELVLREDPDNLYALYNAALMASAQGDPAEATAYYRRYLAALPQEERHRLKYADHPELILVQQATAQRELAQLAAQGY